MKPLNLTLISNDEKSLSLFPDNTAADFTTQLHHTVSLPVQCEIAISEMQFNYAFDSISGDDFYIEYFTPEHVERFTFEELHNALQKRRTHASVKYETGSQKNDSMDILFDESSSNGKNFGYYNIPKGYYKSIHQLVEYINSRLAFRHQSRFSIFVNEDSGKLEFNNDGTYLIAPSPKLCKILGVFYREELNEKTRTVFADIHALVPQQLFVYCNLAEPELVGSGAMPLLRIVGLNNVPEHGRLFEKTYTKLDYIPMLKHHFSSVEIYIRTHLQEPAPFQSAPSIVKVHIRAAQ